MPINYVRPRNLSELSNPFDRDEQALTALATAGALVALADGRVDAIERDEAVDYIVRRRLAPTISRQRIAAFFDARVQRLDDRDFADLVVAAFRPIARLPLASEVIRIAQRIAAADGRIHPSEVQVITLIRLLMMTSSETRAGDQE
jgi:tellurite resistance protein TerB